MALVDIQKKIEDEARQKAEALMADAHATAEKYAAKAEAELAEVKADFDRQLAAETPEIARRAEIVAGLDVNRLMLGAKQDLMSRALEGGARELLNQPEADYLAFCAQLLQKAVVTGDEVVVGGADGRVTENWVAEQNAKQGWKLGFEQGSHKGGGFYLRRGAVSENCTFDTLVRWLREGLEESLAKRLFL